MREIIRDVEIWRARSEKIALATVVETWGSAPRRVGAKMALAETGEISGSVSGGCVEGAVFDSGVKALQTDQSKLLHFGVADETAWDVGLACGGTIEVFVQPLNLSLYNDLREAVMRDETVARVVLIQGPSKLLGRELIVFTDGSHKGDIYQGLNQEAIQKAGEVIALGGALRTNLSLPLGMDKQEPSSLQSLEPVEVFIEVLMPAPKLVMVGGVHIAIALANLAKTLGFKTIVVDPRKAFGNEARFAHVDEIFQVWPSTAFSDIELTASTAVVMLTHDPKIDDPALMIALPSPVFYIGALGSRKTHAGRRARLIQAGVSEKVLDRIHAPVGLDLGGRNPEEIALSIMAQIVAAQHQRLTDQGGLRKG
jgi:xanthine dehydrogenase accessory factor